MQDKENIKKSSDDAQISKRSAAEYRIKLDSFTEKDRFKLAGVTLLVVAILFVLGALAQLFGAKPGEKVFDVFSSILPPIATLIIGYYFGERSRA